MEAALGTYAFRPRERLRYARDFNRVFREGRRFAREGLEFRFAPNGLPYSRLGLAVGRSAGGAVARNRVKRWIREAFRMTKHALARSFDVVVVVRSAPASLRCVARGFEAFASRARDRASERRRSGR